LVIGIETGTMRGNSSKHCGTRRIAGRCGAVGIGEKHTGLRQAIQIWGDSLGMSAHAANPIIQIIHCNKKNVRLWLLCTDEIRYRDVEQGKQQADFVEYLIIHNQCEVNLFDGVFYFQTLPKVFPIIVIVVQSGDFYMRKERNFRSHLWIVPL
jgi:hypothetical protein